MKSIALLLCVFMVGCSSFSTTQIDQSTTDENGKETRTITTKVQAFTFIESKSKLTSFKSQQTDKTQGASVGSLSQESNGTNSVTDAAVFLGTLIKTAK